MDNQRGALSLAEPADPDQDPGQPLMQAHDPIFYRTKAAYVFWMLRGIVGDKPLAAALKQYDAAAGYVDRIISSSCWSGRAGRSWTGFSTTG